ncbi:MAG TPA: DUF58 domain-containing protein, partial [Roseiflexaceae bacterium]|nr:DUF58 domain-containing protein [Roseiflexaceae bacterium]
TLEDSVPPGLELSDGSSQVMLALEAGATATLRYRLHGRRGFYQFGAVTATARDPLGLLVQRVHCEAPARLMVLPEVVRLAQINIRPRRTRIYAGMIPARQDGAGIDFLGVRAYQAGDTTRRLNARAMARSAEGLFVNEFEQERVADIGIILDARARSDVRTAAGALFEHSVGAVAALALALLERGNRVGMLIYGHAVEWTLPGYGRLQRERILRALARATTGDRAALESLDEMPLQLFPARSQLVVISPLLGDDAAPIVRLRARGYQVLVISPDPIAYEEPLIDDNTATRLAVRVARLERNLLIRRLRQSGIMVVEWNTSMPFAQVAAVAFGRYRGAV